MANDFQKWLKARGIYHEVTNANTPQENGVAERLNRTVLEMVRTMMFDSKLPKIYWTFAVKYAQEILNRLPTRAVSENKTPHELFLQKKPSVAHIQIFGCRVYVHVPDEKRSKLDSKAVKGFFVGLSENKKGYVIADSRNHLQLYESCDVTFFEDPQQPERVRIKVSKDYENKDNVHTLNETQKSQSLEEQTEVGGEVEVERQEEVESVRVKERRDDQPTERRQSGRLRHAPVCDDDPRFTRTSYTQQKVPRSTEQVNKAVKALKDPTLYKEAMLREDAVHWKRACTEELEEFVRQKLFSIVPKPIGRKVIGCKWVFKTKLDAEGQIERYKARLVAQGFLQIPGVDFNETFAPVTRHQTLWTLLALANRHQWHIHQMDMRLAFLNGDLENEIFMRIPEGVDSKEGEVWLLHKALYGLKQASREWYLKMKGKLEELGFKQSEADHGVFTKDSDEKIFIIAVYVDDFLLFSELISEIRDIKERLGKIFEMKDLGEARWILQMKVERSDMRLALRTISMSQEQYVEEILERHGMANCNPVKTPIENDIQLPILNEAEVDITEYQRCIGSLMYLMICT